jgi:hypothetical protein
MYCVQELDWSLMTFVLKFGFRSEVVDKPRSSEAGPLHDAVIAGPAQLFTPQSAPDHRSYKSALSVLETDNYFKTHTAVTTNSHWGDVWQ